MNETETTETVCIDDLDKRYKDIVEMNNLKTGGTDLLLLSNHQKVRK